MPKKLKNFFSHMQPEHPSALLCHIQVITAWQFLDKPCNASANVVLSCNYELAATI